MSILIDKFKADLKSRMIRQELGADGYVGWDGSDCTVTCPHCSWNNQWWYTQYAIFVMDQNQQDIGIADVRGNLRYEGSSDPRIKLSSSAAETRAKAKLHSERFPTLLFSVRRLPSPYSKDELHEEIAIYQNGEVFGECPACGGTGRQDMLQFLTPQILSFFDLVAETLSRGVIDMNVLQHMFRVSEEYDDFCERNWDAIDSSIDAVLPYILARKNKLSAYRGRFERFDCPNCDGEGRIRGELEDECNICYGSGRVDAAELLDLFDIEASHVREELEIKAGEIFSAAVFSAFEELIERETGLLRLRSSHDLHGVLEPLCKNGSWLQVAADAAQALGLDDDIDDLDMNGEALLLMGETKQDDPRLAVLFALPDLLDAGDGRSFVSKLYDLAAETFWDQINDGGALLR